MCLYSSWFIVQDSYTYFDGITVQLKCKLIPTHGLPDKKVRVNLQKGACKGAGARNILHQPSANLWHSF